MQAKPLLAIGGMQRLMMVGLLLLGGAPVLALEPAELETLLSEQADVSVTDLKRLGDGFIAKEISVDNRSRGLALIGIMRLDATAEQLHSGIARADAVLSTVEDVSMKAMNFIPQPAPDDLFARYELSKVEKKALETCALEDCRLKLPASLIAQVSALNYRWEKDADVFTQAYRQSLVEMVRSYRQKGDAGLWTYRDKPQPLKAGAGYQMALAEADAALTIVPDAIDYLTKYPQATNQPMVEEFMFWSVLDFGHRPTLTVNHAVSVQPIDNTYDYILSIKMLYANHYFGGRATFGALLKDGVLGVPGPLFILVDYLQFDGELNSLTRALVSRGIVSDIKNRLRLIRAMTDQTGVRN